MPHPRQVIREAVKAQLVGPPAIPPALPVFRTLAGARVYETRRIPWEEVELPAISVYTETDQVEDQRNTRAPRVLERKLQLVIQATVQSSENIDDAMDEIAGQIECAMNLDATFGGKADDSYLVSTEMEFGDLGQMPIGVVVLTYEVHYESSAAPCNAPTSQDFERARVQWSIAQKIATTDPETTDPAAVDEFDVREEDP